LTTNYCHVTWFLQPLSLLLKLNPRVTELTCYDVSPVTPGNIITFRFLGSHFNDWGHRCCCGSQPLLEQQQGHWLHWRGFAEGPRWMPGNTSLLAISHAEVVVSSIDSNPSYLLLCSVFSRLHLCLRPINVIRSDQSIISDLHLLFDIVIYIYFE
jgi:hypothetical protein